MNSSAQGVEIIEPDGFDPVSHFYPRVLNAQIHPLVRFFMSLDNARLAERYCHLHPEVKPDSVHEALAHRTRFMRWGGRICCTPPTSTVCAGWS